MDNPVAIFDLANADLNHLQSGLLEWRSSRVGRYHLQDLPFRRGPTSDVLDAFVECGAFPNSGRMLAARGRGSRFGQALDDLEVGGFAHAVDDAKSGKQWQPTDHGVANLQLLNVMNDPHYVSTPRGHCKSEDWTAWELMSALRSDGWQWHRFPARSTQGAALAPYQLGGEKVWFTAGASANKQYLLALYRSHELFARGVAQMHHWARQRDYYQKVLHAVTDGALEIEPCAERLERPALIADCDMDAIGVAIQSPTTARGAQEGHQLGQRQTTTRQVPQLVLDTVERDSFAQDEVSSQTGHDAEHVASSGRCRAVN